MYMHANRDLYALLYSECNCSGSFFTSPDSSIYHCDGVIVSQFMPHQKTVHKSNSVSGFLGNQEIMVATPGPICQSDGMILI